MPGRWWWMTNLAAGGAAFRPVIPEYFIGYKQSLLGGSRLQAGWEEVCSSLLEAEQVHMILKTTI